MEDGINLPDRAWQLSLSRTLFTVAIVILIVTLLYVARTIL